MKVTHDINIRRFTKEGPFLALTIVEVSISKYISLLRNRKGHQRAVMYVKQTTRTITKVKRMEQETKEITPASAMSYIGTVLSL